MELKFYLGKKRIPLPTFQGQLKIPLNLQLRGLFAALISAPDVINLMPIYKLYIHEDQRTKLICFLVVCSPKQPQLPKKSMK